MKEFTDKTKMGNHYLAKLKEKKESLKNGEKIERDCTWVTTRVKKRGKGLKA